jgi:hypothetical protein
LHGIFGSQEIGKCLIITISPQASWKVTVGKHRCFGLIEASN